MWPYLVVIAAAISLAGASQRVPRRGHPAPGWRNLLRRTWHGWSLYDVALVLVLSLFAGIRWKVGTDFEMYSGMYRRLDATNWARALLTAPQEPGFTLLRLVVKSVVGGAPMWLFLVVALATTVPMVAAFKAWVPDQLAVAVAVWTTCGVWLSSFNGIRQSLACALVVLGVVWLGRRPRLGCLLLVASVTVHVSSLLAIVLLLLTFRWRPSPRRAVATIVGATVAILVALPLLAPVLGLLNPRYRGYIEGADAAGWGTVGQVVLWLLVLAAIARWVPGWNEGRLYRWWLWALMGVGFWAIGLRVVELGRFSLPFRSFVPFLLAGCVAALPPARRRVVLLVGAALLAAHLVIHLSLYDDLLPYRYWPRNA